MKKEERDHFWHRNNSHQKEKLLGKKSWIFEGKTQQNTDPPYFPGKALEQHVPPSGGL